MFTNRLFTLLVVIALLAVAALTVREAFATKVIASHTGYTNNQSEEQAHKEYDLNERYEESLQISSYSQQTYRVYRQGELEYCMYTSFGQSICRR